MASELERGGPDKCAADPEIVSEIVRLGPLAGAAGAEAA
jgi:hypothetical protein